MSETGIDPQFGWIRDYPDFRDFTDETSEAGRRQRRIGQDESVKEMLARISGNVKTPPPSRVDLRPWFPPVRDQQNLGSCTANAATGVLEYCENRAHSSYIKKSRLFIYKVTRNLMHATGDTGAHLRSTMEAMALFGAPPEDYWAYNVPQFDAEPSAFCYAFGGNYQALSYFRHDPSGVTPDAVLKNVKHWLAMGMPAMFGFTVFDSYGQAARTGKLPFPSPRESMIGGHAVVAAGYDDDLSITNASDGNTTLGALLIRNSWGPGWGDQGYGWLPYKYVLSGMAVDWWSLLRSEWVDLGVFGVRLAGESAASAATATA